MFGFLIEAWHRVETSVNSLNGEFDSGSERTLAAWIRHASRTLIRKGESGARVRNTWVICREDWNNSSKDELIPDVDESPKLGTARPGAS